MMELKAELVSQKRIKLSELSARKQQIEKLSAEIEELHNDKNRKFAEVKNLKKGISALENEIASAKKDLEAKKVALNTEEGQYEASKAVIISESDIRKQAIQNTLNDLRRKKETLQNKKQQLESELAKTFALSFGKKKNLRSQIKSLSAEINGLSRDEQKNKTMLSEEGIKQNKQLSALDAEIADLRKKIIAIEEGIAASSKKLESAKKFIEAKEMSIPTLRKEMDDFHLDYLIETYGCKVESPIEQIAVKKKHIEHLTAEALVLQQDIAKIEERINIAEAQEIVASEKRTIEENSQLEAEVNIKVEKETETDVIPTDSSECGVDELIEIPTKEPELLYYKKMAVDAVGYELENRVFVVKKGSKIAGEAKITSSSVTRNLRKKYAEFISFDNILLKDLWFKSANEAANFCTFGIANTTLAWTTKDGISLREYREKRSSNSWDVKVVDNSAPKEAEYSDTIEKIKPIKDVCVVEFDEEALSSNEQTKNTVVQRENDAFIRSDIDESTETEGSVKTIMTEETVPSELMDSHTENPLEIIVIEDDSEDDSTAESEKIIVRKNTDEKAYYTIYHVNPDDYTHVKVKTLGFSVRLENRLLGERYLTVEDVLRANDDIMKNIRGFGKGCFDELHQYLEGLSSSPVPELEEVQSYVIPNELLPYKEQLLWGDFSFVEGKEFGKLAVAYINRYREAHAVLDFEMVEELVNGTPASWQLYEMLLDFQKEVAKKKRAEKILDEIPKNRRTENADRLIKAFTSEAFNRSYLEDMLPENQSSFRDFLIRNADKIDTGDICFNNFLQWCKFDLQTDINHFFSNLKDRELQVIRGRAAGNTLEVVGTSFDVTRERVRQIEKKAVRKFNNWQNQHRIMYKAFIEMNETAGLSSMELMDFVGEYGHEFIYLMKNCEDADFVYDKQLDMFLIEEQSLPDKIQAYVDRLPDTFSEKNISRYIKKAEEEFGYPEKLMRVAIEESYRKTGELYHRYRLTLESIYSAVMIKHYPNGLHVYDPSEIQRFRDLVLEESGLDLSEKSDHAIGSIISRIGLLCGRGIYKIRSKEPVISKELATKIHDYIANRPEPIFMTNTLYSIFEEDLVSQGIDNKYYLQGILRDLYENEWIFRRDYISKDESYTSVYSSIVGFIRNSMYPVAKEDIQRAFPGVTDIVISLAVSDHSVLNLFGQYIHASRLKLSDSDILYLRYSVERCLSERDVCHCKDIYEYINGDYPELLTNNFVNYAFSLYSLLEYLFGENYNFSRPYIANENAQIERVGDLLDEMVHDSEMIEIAEIMSFAREHRYTIYSILEFADSCNDTHLLINDMELASISYIGVTKEIAETLEKCIANEVQETMPIYQLRNISSLPQINVEWNAWLIYSVLKKWGSSLEVAASNSQFRQAYPLVAPKGRMDINSVISENGDHEGKLIVADDLDKIDELIGDYILDGMGDLDEL